VFVYRKGIFCLESEWFGLMSPMSVRYALDFLKSSDYRIPVIHRDVATAAEIAHYLRKWTMQSHTAYSILWIAIHTRRGLLLPGDVRRASERMDIDAMESCLAGKCGGRIIHFGGCRTIALPARRLKQFLRVTRAVAVSGFREEVEWTESTLFEMSYFVALQHHPLTALGMRKVAAHMRKHHGPGVDEFGFSIVKAR
jgi:hypothetical protein